MCATAPSKPWKRTTAHAVSEPMRGVGKEGRREHGGRQDQERAEAVGRREFDSLRTPAYHSPRVMADYILESRVWLARTRAEVFAFFAESSNLLLITPAS